MNLVSLGSDPEYILHKKRGNSRTFVGSQGIIPGNKRRPHRVTHGAIHRDNVLLELNPEPATTEEEFDNNLQVLLDEVQRDYLTPRGAHITNKTSHVFAEKFIQLPETREFGCDGDICAWDVEYEQPIPELVGRLRSAGGHIHLGLDNPDVFEFPNIVQRLDLFISLPLVLLDADVFRRRWYGQAGKYRPKSYGLEYRTPSNCWTFAAENRRWVFRQAQRAVSSNIHIAPVLGRMLQQVINTSDREGAIALINEFSLEMPYVV